MKLNWKFWQRSQYVTPSSTAPDRARRIGTIVGGVLGAYVLVVVAVGWWWSYEPSPFDPVAAAAGKATAQPAATGYTTAVTVVTLAETLLEKRGGYLANDLFPPGVYLDNVPNWEFGVLIHLRDFSRVMRSDFGRSQSQSTEDPDLANAEGLFFFDSQSWIFPSTEDEYREGMERIATYAERLQNPAQATTQFYARADNLSRWLDQVDRRLGDLSQRLSQSVGKRQLNIDLVGEPAATTATDVPADTVAQTSWTQIDDVFFEARGQAWALVHLLKAVERDFGTVLDDKNARVSLQQIIRELEATQEPIRSPMILNGGGFGFLANHSLVMASYISRVNAALTDLRDLLDRG